MSNKAYNTEDDESITRDKTVNQWGISTYKRTFNSLRNPVFRLYYIGILGQRASMNMEQLVRSLLIYRLTGSAALLGVLALTSALPMLLFGFFGGAIADRFHKKYVLIVGMLSSAMVSLIVALALTTGYMNPERTGSWWILIVASGIQGSIMGLMIPSRQSIVREIVTGEQLMNAVALDILGMNAFRFMAPAISGFLTDAFDFEAVYFVMTGLYVMSAAVIAFMPLTRAIVVHSTGALSDIREGIRYIRHETTLLLILAFTLFVVILSMPYMFLMPIFADDILGVGATGMGVLLSVSGVGAIVGSLILASMPNKKRGLMLLSGSVVLGLALIGFSFSNIWYISLVLIAFVGVGQAFRMTLASTLLQYYVDDTYRGRVMSIYVMEHGLSSLGTFFAGLLAEVIGVQWTVGGFAIFLVVLSISALIFVPRVRKLE
ncbi:MAG: MFS transporter [Candidatus Hodarchaeota archaeon]